MTSTILLRSTVSFHWKNCGIWKGSTRSWRRVCRDNCGERDNRSTSSIVMTGQIRQFHIKLILKIECTNYGSFLLFYVFFASSMKEVGGSHKQGRGLRPSTCKPCPMAYGSPVCGSDGHSYSSQVRAALLTQYKINMPIDPCCALNVTWLWRLMCLNVVPTCWFCSRRFWNL